MPEHAMTDLVDFIDGGILAARELAHGNGTEDARRGYAREQALQEVREHLTGARLDPDVRCEHVPGAWRKCRRCGMTDYWREA